MMKGQRRRDTRKMPNGEIRRVPLEKRRTLVRLDFAYMLYDIVGIHAKKRM